MDTLKRAALVSLGVIVFGFMVFSFATIGLAVLGITAVLVVIGLLARPFLPKGARKASIIIDVTPVSSTTSSTSA
jgi:hypothetical protein